MLNFTLRRLLIAVPTLLASAVVIFGLLQLAPGDPMANVPLTVPPEVKQRMREALGLGEPIHIQFWKWLVQFFWIEPQVLIDHIFGTSLSEGKLRVISWQTRSPVMDIVVQRLPQTLWVVGTSYAVGILIALPIGIYSAYRQYSVFDQAGTFISMVGYSVPTFFTGVLLIVIFSVNMPRESFFWFPSIYDTTHVVDSWSSFGFQVRQMFLPVMVLALYNAAQISRFMRASMLDNLNQDYVRTARAKGAGERVVGLGARAAQLADPRRDRDRAWRAAGLRRRHHHRAGVQGERPGPPADRRDRGQRPAHGADADLHLRRSDRALQSHRRCPLRHPRPADPL